MTIGKNMVKRTCYFTKAQWENLQDAAAEEGTNVSYVLRDLVARHLDGWMEDGREPSE